MGRYQAYPEYKDSGVEWLDKVPQHWNIKRVGSLFEERREKVNDVDFPPLSVTMQGIVPQLDNAAKTDAGDNRKLVKAGDFVINSRSDRKGASGISPLTGSVSLISIVMSPRKYNSQFFHHLFRCQAFQEEFYRYGKGIVADLWSTNSSELKNILIPDLPEEEANRIAVFLDHETAKIDTLIEKQQQLIQLLKEKRQAVISHAVTKGLNPNALMKDSGVEWLGEAPEHWDLGKIKNLSILISKGTTPSTIGGEFEASGIRFLKAENIGKGFYALPQPEFYISKQTDEQLARSRLEDKDILVIIAGATTGQASLITEELLPANTNQAVSFIRPTNRKYSAYIVHWLSTGYAQSNIWQNAVQAAQPNLSMETLGNIFIPIPPEDEVVEIVNEIQKQNLRFADLISKSEMAIQLMQERRTALISAAVTGKIDVRNWQAEAAHPIGSR